MEITRPKPLGGRAYGHIPHISGSRMGPGDHHCPEGQSDIATVQTRDRHDRVIATVKLDGSCMAVARINGVIVPLSRAGYSADTSKYEQHLMFTAWVYRHHQRFLEALVDGERMVGEWLAQAHGTRYQLVHEPFVVFDVMIGKQRLSTEQARNKARQVDLPCPAILSEGADSYPLEAAQLAITTPQHGELDPVEGVVWRVERNGVFDFACKWVRPDKVDGKYLPEVSGQALVWNALEKLNESR